MKVIGRRHYKTLGINYEQLSALIIAVVHVAKRGK